MTSYFLSIITRQRVNEYSDYLIITQLSVFVSLLNFGHRWRIVVTFFNWNVQGFRQLLKGFSFFF